MKELAKSPDEMKTLIEECLRTKTRPLGPTLKQFEKPVIAAVNGYAVAGGLELALMCDLRIVEETAVLGMYNRRFGIYYSHTNIPMTDGGSVRLPKMIGLSRALDMIITGRQINGKIAFDWGLANRIVDTGTVAVKTIKFVPCSALGQAMNLARIIGTLPKTSLLNDRNSTRCNSNCAMPTMRSPMELGRRMMVCVGNNFNNRSSVFVVCIDDEKFYIFPAREEQLVRSTCLTAAALWNKNVETICPN
ncbi:enoyl-coA hydratase/isomerase family protein [Trichinella spiralis]|uniref:enoyl-coA hydratase/isomerase family protein n=1 Tax=Trichinella spiralis TaxID=6334 RepID=UPI0001EFD00A|nr:enoyl-coA hydratase/isomerase family protein [Trichinella spiralis]